MDRLKNKVAVITGSGSGIGRGVAFVFSREGAKIIVSDLNQEGGLGTVQIIREAKGVAEFIRANVREPSEVKNLIDSTVAKFGRIDILVNNAGIALDKDIVTELSIEEWDLVLNTNLRSVFLGCKYAIPYMIKQGGGSIINTSSVSGFAPARNLSSYCASKAGILILTKAMSADFGKFNIRINCVCPGEILTPMSESGFKAAKVADRKAFEKEILALYPLGRFGTPEDVGKAMLYLASDDANWVTGEALVVDGGATSFIKATSEYGVLYP